LNIKFNIKLIVHYIKRILIYLLEVSN